MNKVFMLTLSEVALYDFLKNTRYLSAIEEITYQIIREMPNLGSTRYHVTMTASNALNVSLLLSLAYLSNLDDLGKSASFEMFSKSLARAKEKKFVIRNNDLSSEAFDFDGNKYNFDL
jgi:hypothetical protein